MTNTATTGRFDISDLVTDDQRETNERKFDSYKHWAPCHICGKGLTAESVEKGWVVTMATDLTLFDMTDGSHKGADDVQGSFPVGPECARQIPRQYRFKNSYESK